MIRATDAERARLNETFAELCRIPSPSGHEGACAAYVTAALRELGLDPTTDAEGNVLVRLGAGEGGVLLCAHLDTVIPLAPIDPVCEDGIWTNANSAILGADNKAAVALMLEIARRQTGKRPGVHPGGGTLGRSRPLELLFTVREETGLEGARAFDASTLRSERGYVFDIARPIGEIVMAAPTAYHVEATFHGTAAHAGICPERGRSAIVAAARAVAAMPDGRLDAETTVNVGRIDGGTGSTNVVPDRCVVIAETRSLDRERVEGLVRELVDHLQDAANRAEVDVDVVTECRYHGYRLRREHPTVAAAEAALRACGFGPVGLDAGGGSDVNALRGQGFDCVNLANGTENAHQPDERVSVRALEDMLDVVLNLLTAPDRQLSVV